jgi:hypothetical protein
MKNLRQLIKENLLLEKRIAQISSKIEVIFSFDVIKTTHSTERETRFGISDYNEKNITNPELADFIEWFRRDIAEHIVSGEIVDGVDFIIKSDDRELACVIVPRQETNTYWRLVIKTIWRESPSNRLRVGREQLVLVK